MECCTVDKDHQFIKISQLSCQILNIRNVHTSRVDALCTRFERVLNQAEQITTR